MFRRRSSKTRVFSRQLSLQAQVSVPAPGGGGAASTLVNTELVTYTNILNATGTVGSSVVGSGFANIIKSITIRGISWTSDYTAAGSTGTISQILFGSECLFVDRTEPGQANTNEPVAQGFFLNVNQLDTQWDPNRFPERILHRRRFTTGVISAATGTQLFPTASNITAGFGTERHIRRPVTLKPNQGLFWRFEVYNFVLPDTGTGSVLGDILGVISYSIQT